MIKYGQIFIEIVSENIYSIRFRQVRESLGLRQTDFAQKLGIPRTSSINYEKGTSIPSEVLNSLVDCFNVNSSWFLSGKGEMFLSIQEKTLENTHQTEEKHPLMANPGALIDQRLEKIEVEIVNLKKIESKIAYIESRLEKAYPDAPDFDIYTSEPEPEYLDYVDDIAAGRPIYASEDRKTIPVPKYYIKTKPEDYYAGHIRGTSMIAAGIPNGALVLIRKSDFPRHNAIQVVECQGEVTLKRMREIPGKGWRICFDDYSEDFLEVGPEDEFHIQGDFVAIIPEDE